MFTAAVAPVVQVNQLSHIAQGRPLGAVVGMVSARAAMQEQHRRALAHAGPVRHQLRPFNIEEELNAIDKNMHKEP